MRARRHLRLWVVAVFVLNLIPIVGTPNVAIAGDSPALTYFALGDSYASGHGLADDGRACRRSSLAYPFRVQAALRETLGSVDLRHLACSGATAGPTFDMSNPDKVLTHQYEEVVAELDDRRAQSDTSPVLVSITIGANDVGLLEPDTLVEVLRKNIIGDNGLDLNTTPNFFAWLDDQTRPIFSSLTPIIDTLLTYENVHIVLTDYPSPFAPGAFGAALGVTCNDVTFTLTCDEALERILIGLNGVVVDHYLQVNQQDRLRVAPLMERFSEHPGVRTIFDCFRSVEPESWFQTDCAHPNELGAQAIADAIVEEALVMLSASGDAPSGPVDDDVPQSPSDAPVFHLPWEAGSVWQVTEGNGEDDINDAANYYGFEAVPVPGLSTDQVVAVADGTVMDLQESMPDVEAVNGAHAGNCVIIDHGDNMYSLYAHLEQGSVPLAVGDFVGSGTAIGTMGNSGYSTAPHLFWAIVSDAYMYTDDTVSPYRTCSGTTLASRYADPDPALEQDGGIPRAGRLYESFNSSVAASGDTATAEPGITLATAVTTTTPTATSRPPLFASATAPVRGEPTLRPTARPRTAASTRTPTVPSVRSEPTLRPTARLRRTATTSAGVDQSAAEQIFATATAAPILAQPDADQPGSFTGIATATSATGLDQAPTPRPTPRVRERGAATATPASSADDVTIADAPSGPEAPTATADTGPPRIVAAGGGAEATVPAEAEPSLIGPSAPIGDSSDGSAPGASPGSARPRSTSATAPDAAASAPAEPVPLAATVQDSSGRDATWVVVGGGTTPDWRASVDPVTGKAWLEIDLGSEATVDRVEIVWSSNIPAQTGLLLVSSDGRSWQPTAPIAASAMAPGRTASIPVAETTRWLRIELTTTQPFGQSGVETSPIQVDPEIAPDVVIAPMEPDTSGEPGQIESPTVEPALDEAPVDEAPIDEAPVEVGGIAELTVVGVRQDDRAVVGSAVRRG